MDNLKDDGPPVQTVEAECVDCGKPTNHKVERFIEESRENKAAGLRTWQTYEIIRCNGCATISFRETYLDSESVEYNDADESVPGESVKLYPERKKRFLMDGLYLRGDVDTVPQIIRTVYKETLLAFQHGMPILAAVGIRATIEAVCRERGINMRNLEQNINKLVAQGILTPDKAKTLHNIRELGNDSAHEMKAPTSAQTTAALKVTDHLLLDIYILKQQAAVLDRPRPGA